MNISSLSGNYRSQSTDSKMKITGKKIDEGQRLTIVNKHIAWVFENKSPEVKEEIRKMQEKEKRARDIAKDIEKQVANGELLTADQLLL